jgi:hypothetical protein
VEVTQVNLREQVHWLQLMMYHYMFLSNAKKITQCYKQVLIHGLLIFFATFAYKEFKLGMMFYSFSDVKPNAIMTYAAIVTICY